MKLELSGQIFKEFSSTKFHQNLSSGSRVVPYGQTDVYDEAKSRFSQFCECAWRKPTQQLGNSIRKMPQTNRRLKDYCRRRCFSVSFDILYPAASAFRVPVSHSRATLRCTTRRLNTLSHGFREVRPCIFLN